MDRRHAFNTIPVSHGAKLEGFSSRCPDAACQQCRFCVASAVGSMLQSTPADPLTSLHSADGALQGHPTGPCGGQLDVAPEELTLPGPHCGQLRSTTTSAWPCGPGPWCRACGDDPLWSAVGVRRCACDAVRDAMARPVEALASVTAEHAVGYRPWRGYTYQGSGRTGFAVLQDTRGSRCANHAVAIRTRAATEPGA
jgi:hypothetical protein